MTAIVGATLQLNKLAVLDGAGREFGQTSYSSKTSFLVPYALFKAACNLGVGGLADTHGRKPIALTGSVVGLLGPLMVLFFCVLVYPNDATKAWPAFVGSSAFLGIHQGITWTSTVLITLDLCGANARGLASGLSETIGYTFIAIFAEIYGAIERGTIECNWVGVDTSDVSSSTPHVTTPECLLANKNKKCNTPDDFHPECVNQCVCMGYAASPFGVQLALAAIGVAICAAALKESKPFRGWSRDSRSEQSHNSEIVLGSIGTHNEHTLHAAKSGDFVELETLESDDTLLREEGGELRNSDGGQNAGGFTRNNDGHSTPLSFSQSFYRTTWGDRSLAVVSFAGFCANFETGMAWGLLASWARDGLGMSGQKRDAFMAAYSFCKGFSQLFAGILSDKVGRRWCITVGLFGGAFSLCLAAFGAGYDGKFTAGDDGESLDQRFTNLVVAGVLLGLFTGLMYPVLAAAAADHAPSRYEIAATVGVIRFWRDLGYAMGMPVSILADATRPETSLLFVACVMALAGTVVGVAYRENKPH